MPTVDEIRDWAGREAVGPDGGKVGKIDHLYLDRQTGEPTFASVKTGLLGSSSSLVPVEGARLSGEDVQLAFDKGKVKDAPNVDADAELSEAEEAKLYEHYGIAGYSQYDGPDHDTITTRDRERVGRDTSGPETDDAMTRSEEELRVGTRKEEVGKARLRKYIVTENVTKTVPVQREEVRIEREPITDANRDAATSGADLSEEEHEVTLHAETPVVEKDVVAKERVRLDKDVSTQEVQVDETVRKEVIETDTDGDTTRR